MWKRSLPDFAGGACTEMRKWKKPWPRYSMTQIIMDLLLYGLRYLSKARSGAKLQQDLHTRTRGELR